MTIWLAEQGLLASPICITNTHAVGVVRDAICRLAAKRSIEMAWHLPVTAETFDGWLSDAEQFPVTSEDAIAALESARGGPVPEGNVGGGTGMICHEFKGGIGTASRVLGEAVRPWWDASFLPWAVVLGGAGQAVGLAVYFWAMWPRIRPVGSHLREAKGERF